jgi:hypothetical protein
VPDDLAVPVDVAPLVGTAKHFDAAGLVDFARLAQ